MNNYLAFGLATLTVLANTLIGYLVPPNSIMLTPVILTITTALVVFGTTDIKPISLSLFTYLFVAANDILIKLYSGGSHDSEGLGWIHMLLFIGLLPTIGLLLAGIFKSKSEKLRNKLLAIGFFLTLIITHFQLFGELGIGRVY